MRLVVFESDILYMYPIYSLLIVQVERHFLTLDELGGNEKEFNVSVKVRDTGQWFLKFRKMGLIYNRMYEW